MARHGFECCSWDGEFSTAFLMADAYSACSADSAARVDRVASSNDSRYHLETIQHHIQWTKLERERLKDLGRL